MAKFDPHGTGSVALVARYVVIVLISARLPGPFVSVNANLHTAPRWWFKDLQHFHFPLLSACSQVDVVTNDVINHMFQ